MSKKETIFDRYEKAYKIDPDSSETKLLKLYCESVKEGTMTEREAKLSHTYWKKARENNPYGKK